MRYEKLTTIAVTWENYKELKSRGQAGDSFNDVISKLLAVEQPPK